MRRLMMVPRLKVTPPLNMIPSLKMTILLTSRQLQIPGLIGGSYSISVGVVTVQWRTLLPGASGLG
jgi:hypothetical protein